MARLCLQPTNCSEQWDGMNCLLIDFSWIPLAENEFLGKTLLTVLFHAYTLQTYDATYGLLASCSVSTESYMWVSPNRCLKFAFSDLSSAQPVPAWVDFFVFSVRTTAMFWSWTRWSYQAQVQHKFLQIEFYRQMS